MTKTAKNKVADYISGLPVNATPEEIDSVQVFAKQLVEDYGYSKEQIQTHPQYRVKACPSDTKKSIPSTLLFSPRFLKMKTMFSLLLSVKRKIGKTVKIS